MPKFTKFRTKYPVICSTGEVAENYNEYLKTEHWQQLRRLAAFREKNLCQKCKRHIPDSFNVHHRTYKRVGNEYLSDLMFLCQACHLDQHTEKPPTPKDEIINRVYSNIVSRLKKLDHDHLVELRDLINTMIK